MTATDGIAPAGTTRAQRVLLIIPTLGQGGAQRVMVDIANYLNQQGLDITLLAFSEESARHVYNTDPGVRRVHLGTLTGGSARSAGILATPFRLHRYLSDHPVDIILSFQDIANFFTLLASLGRTCRVLVSERQDLHHYRLPRLRAWVRRLLYPRAERIIVQTQMVAAQLPATWKPRIVVLPNAIPALPAALTQAGRSASSRRDESERKLPTIIAAGRLAPQKDFPLLIDAIAGHAALRNGCRVRIFGEGPLRPTLLTQIAASGLQDVILLEGLSDTLWQEMSTADLFVLSSRYEGFPNVLAEAVALGLPSIGYASVSGVSELIEHQQNGLLLEDRARNPGDLGEAIWSIIENEAIMTRMRRHTLTIAERYQPENILQQWQALVTGVNGLPESAR